MSDWPRGLLRPPHKPAPAEAAAAAAARGGRLALDVTFEPRSRPVTPLPAGFADLEVSMMSLSLGHTSGASDPGTPRGRAGGGGWTPMNFNLSLGGVTLPLDSTFWEAWNTTDLRPEVPDAEFRQLVEQYAALEAEHRALEGRYLALEADLDARQRVCEERGASIRGQQRNAQWYEARMTALDVEAEGLQGRHEALWATSSRRLTLAREELEAAEGRMCALRSLVPMRHRELEATAFQVANARSTLGSQERKAAALERDLTAAQGSLRAAKEQNAGLLLLDQELDLVLAGTVEQTAAVEGRLRDQRGSAAAAELAALTAALARTHAKGRERDGAVAAVELQLAADRAAAEAAAAPAHAKALALCTSLGVALPKDAAPPIPLRHLEAFAPRQAAELAEILGILTRMLAEREEGQAV